MTLLEGSGLLLRLSPVLCLWILSETTRTLDGFPSSIAFSFASRAAILADVLQQIREKFVPALITAVLVC